MSTRQNPPSITATAFDCPHCGAFTSQRWLQPFIKEINVNTRTPSLPNEETKKDLQEDKKLSQETRNELLKIYDNFQSGLAFLEHDKNGTYVYDTVHNLYLSQCYNCKRITIWVHDKLIFPPLRSGVSPNSDLPEEIMNDFEEARSILNLSPRGAAALLRLAVQKLCAFLGEKGKNIDEDIASLIAKGLNPLVQQSLDIVRVIGNEAVHPGTIDIKDDRDTAIQLLQIVNIIAEQMLTHPKTIKTMYELLPEGKRKAIDNRNERALDNGKK